jgi:hypothetical protein
LAARILRRCRRAGRKGRNGRHCHEILLHCLFSVTPRACRNPGAVAVQQT